MAKLIKTMDTDGMCNRLFPFGHLIAFAAEFGHTVEHHAFAAYSNYFLGSHGQNHPRFFPGTQRRDSGGAMFSRLRPIAARVRRKLGMDGRILLRSGQGFRVNPSSISAHLGKQNTLQLTGFYFDATDAFLKHVDLVRAYFAPADRLQAKIDRFWKQLNLESETVVGVHVRHGDYATHADGLLWYSENEYAGLMHHIASLFPDQKLKFLIASNADLDLAAFDGLSIAQAPGHELLDLYCLTKCDYLIGPDSTYTEWASFYGNVPRYVHRKKAMKHHQQTWTAPLLSEFQIHQKGFSRCSPDHPAYNALEWAS